MISMISAESINQTEFLPAMTLGGRIKKVREIMGLNQKDMATKMKVTAHTYSSIEEDTNPKYSTVKKFCDILGINISFLFAEDVPVTADNIQFFDSIKDKCFLLTHEQMRQKVEVYCELLKLNEDDSGSTQGLIENHSN